jgi:mannose-6-phosphate isomerase-like protein (cupin superfamily)
MGFRTGSNSEPAPPYPLKANIEDVPTQLVSGHPSSTLYRLLMGDRESKRDRIAAGDVLTSLFLMEIAPGGTNFPHHHEREEEIYLVLDGHGDMVAGGGMDGIEGRHPARAGDVYFFRLNCTVGYYSAPQTRSRILAVRSWYPGMAVPNAEH